MKPRSLALALAACGLLAALPSHAVEPGQYAPELTLPGLRGRLDLAENRGHVTYVDFWASWCGPCRQSFPWMNELQARYGSKGLRVIAVNLDKKRADADRFLDENRAEFAVGFDPAGDSAKRYGIKGMPSSVLLGPDGKVLMVHSGFRSEDRQALEDRIAAALGAR